MGQLYLVATPIGNLEDVTLRALRILREAEVLVCEDTRRTRILLDRYEIPVPATVLSCNEFNERDQARRILRMLDEGRMVALCSDAGYPLVSDPGYPLLAGAIEAGHEIDVIPGPSAVLTALALSGLPVASFTFKGFPPRKPGQRRKFLEMERDQPHTLIFFESPHRLALLLRDAYSVLGNRQAVVCIELTKKFQGVYRETLQQLSAMFATKAFRGEVTVVIAGNNRKFVKADDPSVPQSQTPELDQLDQKEDDADDDLANDPGVGSEPHNDGGLE